MVVSGLAGPWEVTWGPDNMLWVTERTGKRVTRIDPASGERSVAITIDEVSAPGGQDGLLGMALHPELLQGSGNDYVYVAYTYVDESKGADPTITDPKSPYRYLYAKIVRLTYDTSEWDAVQSASTSSPGCRPAMTTWPGASRSVRTGSSILRSATRATISSATFASPSSPSGCRPQKEIDAQELCRLRGQIAASQSRWFGAGGQSEARRGCQPRLHLRSPQPAGHRLRSGRHALCIRARAEDR